MPHKNPWFSKVNESSICFGLAGDRALIEGGLRDGVRISTLTTDESASIFDHLDPRRTVWLFLLLDVRTTKRTGLAMLDLFCPQQLPRATPLLALPPTSHRTVLAPPLCD